MKNNENGLIATITRVDAERNELHCYDNLTGNNIVLHSQNDVSGYKRNTTILVNNPYKMYANNYSFATAHELPDAAILSPIKVAKKYKQNNKITNFLF